MAKHQLTVLLEQVLKKLSCLILISKIFILQEIASDGLKGRVFEVSLGDLNENEDSFRKFKLIVEETQGKICLTNFHGMDLTTDKLRSMIKKRQTTIESFVDVKTTDGYVLRVFSIAFTKNPKDSTRVTSYAQHSKVTQFFLTLSLLEVILNDEKNRRAV